MIPLYQFFQRPALTDWELWRRLERAGIATDTPVETEWCYSIAATRRPTAEEWRIIEYLLGDEWKPNGLQAASFFGNEGVVEIGPRLNHPTTWSSSFVAVCHACGARHINRVERSLRYRLPVHDAAHAGVKLWNKVHDPMTEIVYPAPLDSFDHGLVKKETRVVPVLEQGRKALEDIKCELGFSWDEQDIIMYTRLFVEVLRANPTDAALFKLEQMNSEHSRHWFFRGKLVIDGVAMPCSLLDLIREPLRQYPTNTVVGFGDDSSSQRGWVITVLFPEFPGLVCRFNIRHRDLNPICEIESHNYPTEHEPFQGAATGAGGDIRDLAAYRRGGLVSAGVAGYCTANLHIPDYDLPWEQDHWSQLPGKPTALDIAIRASDGASWYGNCFGRPLVAGFFRSFGLDLPDERRSWDKPIMLSGGIGLANHDDTPKHEPEPGMLIVHLGGPGLRIGVGGGGGSSKTEVGTSTEEAARDFLAVQRGDPEMENRPVRVIRACVELGDDSPIEVVGDSGAGGIGNVGTELVSPVGGRIDFNAVPVGDPTLSHLEIASNEAQERFLCLVRRERYTELKAIADREECPCDVIGEVTDDGYITWFDSVEEAEPIKLPLNEVLAHIPQKTFHVERVPRVREAVVIPSTLTFRDALCNVLRLSSVGSKRWLTTKVDHSVGGLVAQQQYVGPHMTTLADCAVVAHSYFDQSGTALSIGEQPMKGLVSSPAAARLSLAEAMLNMAGVRITDLAHIKCSANWMLAANKPGEGAWLWDAAEALRDMFLALRGVGADGGKDSLRMFTVAQDPSGEHREVKAPGQLVITAYATMDDVTWKVTPDFKHSGSGIYVIRVNDDKRRLGGSALAHTLRQVGNDCPDVDDVDTLARVFRATQEMIEIDCIQAVHDISDGGLVVALLEMAFAGCCGVDVNLQGGQGLFADWFAEEPGLLIEAKDCMRMEKTLRRYGLVAQCIGTVTNRGGIVALSYNGERVLSERVTELRYVWEMTSTALDQQQANPDCVSQEAVHNRHLKVDPPYRLTFDPEPTPSALLQRNEKPRVACVRAVGTNGDRELAAAFYAAGFEVWDISMSDLLTGKVALDNRFRGVAFPGGFSFMDVPEAGKGWEAVVRFNPNLQQQFAAFRDRPDTFSFGTCNGCQMETRLGWVADPYSDQVRFEWNTSRRFEFRFPSVQIQDSPAIMLRGMEGSTLGIWSANGEGFPHFQSTEAFRKIDNDGLAPIRYVDSRNNPTNSYPENPSGSPHGIAGLCSSDGRHLVMMPHPERGFLLWQWPWLPKSWQQLEASPWLRLFQNAFRWCQETA